MIPDRDALLLVDASVYIFRAWYSSDPLPNRHGHSVNAVQGFAHFLINMLERVRSRHFAICFDTALGTGFRHDIDPNYKANRDPAPEELDRQMRWCRDVAASLGLMGFHDEKYEADDLIGTLLHGMHKEGFRGVIVTSDKDLAQLLKPGDLIWDYAKQRIEDPDAVKERMGVYPDQIADLLALSGDSVDNISGVPGIGNKTAAQLLELYGDLDTIYARLDSIPNCGIRGAKRVHKLLSEHRDAAYHSLRLTTIATDAPLDATPSDLHWQGPDLEDFEALCRELDLEQGLLDRVRYLGAN